MYTAQAAWAPTTGLRQARVSLPARELGERSVCLCLCLRLRLLLCLYVSVVSCVSCVTLTAKRLRLRAQSRHCDRIPARLLKTHTHRSPHTASQRHREEVFGEPTQPKSPQEPSGSAGPHRRSANSPSEPSAARTPLLLSLRNPRRAPFCSGVGMVPSRI